MTASFLLDNLLAWSAQLCVLVAVAAPAALTLRHPRARLIFWQGILAMTLLLPAIEPWAQTSDAGGAVSTATAPATILENARSHSSMHWKREYLLGLVASGAVLRMIWIAAGFLRLRRHRLAARALTQPPVPFEGAHVQWYLSDTVSGPVTFGWLRPAILLPTRVNDLPADLREAIACHELVHIRRRDWLFVLAEELIRSLLWFHPAVWFVLSRIQLAREQVVDLEVVRLTCDRERYLDALIAVAGHRLQPDVVPAPLFLKKRQLAVRVAAVLKETSMSKSRLVASFTTVGSAALIAVRLAVWFFPFQSPAQVAADSPGVSVESGATLMHRTPVFYPRGAKAAGTVLLEASLNAQGEVTDARVLSGPEELRGAALQSVLQWHYSTEAALPPVVQISIRFGEASTRAAAVPPRPTQAPRAASESIAILRSIEFAGLPPELEQKVRDRLPVRQGDQVSQDVEARLPGVIKEVDDHLDVFMTRYRNASPDGQIQMTLHIRLAGPQPPPPAPALPGVPRIRVGGNVQAVNLITKVTPVYPQLAKQARIQGTVRLTAIIGKDGTIQNLELVSGDPLLAPSATDAVKQWVYRPTLLNGQPVEVITQIDVNFTLAP